MASIFIRRQPAFSLVILNCSAISYRYHKKYIYIYDRTVVDNVCLKLRAVYISLFLRVYRIVFLCKSFFSPSLFWTIFSTKSYHHHHYEITFDRYEAYFRIHRTVLLTHIGLGQFQFGLFKQDWLPVTLCFNRICHMFPTSF